MDKNSKIKEMTRNEISAVEKSDKISKLEKESIRNKKLIEGFKDREKTSARALVLYERKIRYLKENLIKDILDVCGKIDRLKKHIDEVVKEENYSATEISSYCLQNLMEFEDELYTICNNAESTATISKKDRDFISNVVVQPEPNPTDLNSRFEKLKLEFEQKIGASAFRKRGRPKKGEQSIVADIGLGKKMEKKIDESVEVEDKLKDLFYSAPKNSGAMSDIPQTNDSVFDFNEALNPDISLKDIMNEIMAEKDEEERVLYGSSLDLQKYNLHKDESRAQMLESGIISKPNVKVNKNIKSLDNTGNGLKK